MHPRGNRAPLVIYRFLRAYVTAVAAAAAAAAADGRRRGLTSAGDPLLPSACRERAFVLAPLESRSGAFPPTNESPPEIGFARGEAFQARETDTRAGGIDFGEKPRCRRLPSREFMARDPLSLFILFLF